MQFTLDRAQDLRLRNLLQDVLPELISFHFESNKLPVLAEFHCQFTRWISDEGFDLSKINGSIRIQNPHKNDISPEVLLDYSRNIETSFPNMKTICWNLLWSKDEEGLTQSISTFFSDIIHYFSKIQSHESIQKLLKHSILKVEITSNYIFEIIRLRAIRILWNNLYKKVMFGSS